MLADVLPYLRCPVCRRPLRQQPAPPDTTPLRQQPARADTTPPPGPPTGPPPERPPAAASAPAPAPAGQSVDCPAGHRFDLARQGYLNLITGRTSHPGDTPAMLAARAAFLSTGGYDFIADAVTEVTAGRTGLLLDAGAGTGHQLARTLEALPGTVGLAIDAAKPAARRAARAHPRIGALVADIWRGLPVADHAASVLLNVFAPRNPTEFARVLAPDGLLVVVTPTEAHLGELAVSLGGADEVRLLRIDPAKPAQVTAGLAAHFQPGDERIHTRRLALTRKQVTQLVLMGPSAAHTDPSALTRAMATLPEPVEVTASVRLTAYRR